MIPKPKTCEGCPLYGDGLGFSSIEGTGSLGVLVVAEALGARERADGLPLRPHADAGSVFQRALKLAGVAREQLCITNIVRCQPPGNFLEGAEYEREAIEHCSQYFREAIGRFYPKVILALGNVALRTLTGLTGDHRTVTSLRGYVLQALDYSGVVVVPSYHPSYIRRGAGQLFRVLVEDIRRAVAVAREQTVTKQTVQWINDPLTGKPTRTVVEQPVQTSYILNPMDDPRLSYQTDPTVEDAEKFYQHCKDNPELVISYDIETDRSAGKAEGEVDNEEMGQQITLVQFSHTPGSGIALPFNVEYRDVISNVLGLGNNKVGHNVWLFDNPILLSAGIQVWGEVSDTLWMWHHMQPDLPADLQFVASWFGMPFPWKHYAGPNLRFYGVADADATLRISQQIPEAMKKLKVWDSWVRQRQQLRPILERMKARGVGTDADQLVVFGQQLSVEIERVRREILLLVPAELNQFKPFKGIPKDVREFVAERLPVIESSIRAQWPVGQKMTKAALAKELRPQKEALQQLGFEELGYVRQELCLANPTEKELEQSSLGLVDLWTKPLEFNPGSWQQVMAYAKHRKHKVPVVSAKQNGMKVKRESVNEKALLQLSRRTKDPFYKLVLDYREPVKMKGTYVGDVETRSGGFMPGLDGRIRADFTYRPANGQLATRNGPALMTAPKHGVLADQFRRAIVAKPGCKLIEVDWKSFHILTLGFESQDATYMRLARGDMHSFFAATLLRLEQPDKLLSMNDDEMIYLLKFHRKDERARFPGPKNRMLTFQQVRDQQAKPAILGMGLGQQANRLWEENEDFIDSKAEAQKLIDLWKALFPKEVAYQRNVRELAHRQHYLLSRYGYIRWFWNVLQWNSNWQRWEPGPDSESAISHFVQNDAFGMMYDVMLELGEKGLDERFGLILNMHDALVFECPEAIVDECVVTVTELMERPSRVLVDPKVAPGGLSCKVETKIGLNLGEMSEIKLG
jgi:DNA polymerase